MDAEGYLEAGKKLYLNVDSSKMFYQRSTFRTIDTQDFDTSRVTDMSEMFRQCYEITSLDVTGFNTENMTNMGDLL